MTWRSVTNDRFEIRETMTWKVRRFLIKQQSVLC